MHWIRAEKVKIEYGNFYVVRTNGREHGDHDLHLWPAPLLERHMRPGIVRGRPVWVALVTEPESDSESKLRESIDPDTLEAVADEIDCYEHSARAGSLRILAKRQREAKQIRSSGGA